MSTSDEEWFLLVVDDGQSTTGASEALLSQLRSMSGAWQSLGVSTVATNACYRLGQLIICIDIYDRTDGVMLGTLRVDHLNTSICGAWVDSCIA